MYASPAHLVADLGTQYIAHNVVMPYLRGTLTKANRRPRGVAGRYRKPTLENRIAHLQRQLNKQKPAVVRFVYNGTIAAAGATNRFDDIALIDSLIGHADFRDKINGEDILNKYIKVRFITQQQVEKMRVVIYRPYKTGNIYNPGAGTDAAFVNIPNNKEFQIFYDGMVDKKFSTNNAPLWLYIPLRDMLTSLDESSGIEKGDLRMTVLTDTTAGFTTTFQVEHGVVDK